MEGFFSMKGINLLMITIHPHSSMSSIHTSVYLSHPCINLPIHILFHSSITSIPFHPSILPIHYFHLAITSMYPSFHSYTVPFTHQFTHPSIHTPHPCMSPIQYLYLSITSMYPSDVTKQSFLNVFPR